MADQPSPPAQPRNDQHLRKRIRTLAWIALLVALILAAIGITIRLVTRAHLRTRTASDAIMAVTTVKPEWSGAGDELVLPGTVQAHIEAAIYARTSGYLRRWYTDIGARVRKGQLLAVIDTPEVDRQLAQGRADLATAEANLALARSTNERWQQLLKTKSVSQQDADQRAANFAASTTQVESAAQNVARLQDLESYKRVVAPFDGVVTARNTDIGALINAGEASSTELFRVADVHELRIYAQVPEAYATVTTTGTRAELHFAERPAQTYLADAVRTSNALDPSARTLQVELDLDNRNGDLLPGAYVEVHFKLPASAKTLRLPANTFLFRAAGLQVATVDGTGHVKMKNILMGRDLDTTIEVLKGLDPTDQVIVNPPDSILDGEAVRPAAKPPAPTISIGNSS
jgi:RND family efflux transporter MFP subunit